MGGKGSGAMVAKGLDKVVPGETLPKYYQSNSPYVQKKKGGVGIPIIFPKSQLMTQTKQLMKQAQSQ